MKGEDFDKKRQRCTKHLSSQLAAAQISIEFKFFFFDDSGAISDGNI